MAPEAKFHGEAGRWTKDGRYCWLLKPLTFMNRSGIAVASLARFHKLAAHQMLVVHDDLDLPPGTARLKQGGGHGGHNGLRDIMAHLGENGFYRLRIGIGHPGVREDVISYVLHAPTAEQRQLMEQALERALEVLPLLLQGEMQRAIHRLHSYKPVQDQGPSDE
jgi:PTH1 family peptidyl-tRNA hydrolase